MQSLISFMNSLDTDKVHHFSRGYECFFMLNLTEHEIQLLIKSCEKLIPLAFRLSDVEFAIHIDIGSPTIVEF